MPISTATRPNVNTTTRTIFDARTLRAAYKWNFGYGIAPRVKVAPEKVRAIVDALVKASTPARAKVVAPAPVTVRQWPTDAEVEARWIETTFSKDEVQYARLMGLSFAEARAEPNENANLAAQAADYDKDHADAPQTFESGEFDEARMCPAVVTDEETSRTAPKRHKRSDAAKTRRLAVAR